jgi:putative sterol carrier protein
MTTLLQLFQNLPLQLNNQELLIRDASIQFNITGEDAGDWFLRIHNGQSTIEQGCAREPDLSISCSLKDLISLTKGEMDPSRAFMLGNLTIQGDKTIALQLLRLLQHNRN